MKKQFKFGIFAILIMLTGAAYSQVPVQWIRTLQMEGYWEGPVTLNLGGQTFNLTYHTNFKTVIDDGALTMDEGFINPSLGELKGTNLIGLNSADGLIHWSSVDNFGTAHEHIGSWLSPKHFYMEHHSMQGGQVYAEFIDITLKANNHKVALKLIATLDTDTVETLTGTLTRKNQCKMSVNAGIKNTEESEVNIYPNPTDGAFEITSENIIDGIKITNEEGQLVYQATPNDTNVSFLLNKAGIYFMLITSANKTETRKLTVTK